MKRLMPGFILVVFCLSAYGCASVGSESFWDKGERNTRLACVVPIIGCLPNLFFTAGQVADKDASKESPEKQKGPDERDAIEKPIP